jgi:hypothetical protein
LKTKVKLIIVYVNAQTDKVKIKLAFHPENIKTTVFYYNVSLSPIVVCVVNILGKTSKKKKDERDS